MNVYLAYGLGLITIPALLSLYVIGTNRTVHKIVKPLRDRRPIVIKKNAWAFNFSPLKRARFSTVTVIGAKRETPRRLLRASQITGSTITSRKFLFNL